MARPQIETDSIRDTHIQRVFAGALGVLLGLSLLKFGNPVIMDAQVGTPGNAFEWFLTAWPVAVGQWLLVLVALLGVLVFRRQPLIPWWMVISPLPWLAWQFVASIDSVDPSLTRPTLNQFCTNTGCFYLGLFCLSPVKHLRGFWSGLLVGFVCVLLSGWQQHFGGLEATRAYFFEEVYPTMHGEVPEALMKRMSSNRIFATLFYPNTLAGAVLLLTPVCIGAGTVWLRKESVRRTVLLTLLILAAGCLLWSGSKGGWLLSLGLALVALLRLRFSRALKVAIALGVVTVGLAGFAWKYAGYFQGGAQSAAARLDYWEAAVETAMANPVTGTGPGTFGESYRRIKRPESEMALLAHNDYLQQAGDSGIPGFIFFTGFIVITMTRTGCRVWTSQNKQWFWVWLGLLGIVLQSSMEFGWYIPALSWTLMTLLGWLVGCTTNDLDNLKPA